MYFIFSFRYQQKKLKAWFRSDFEKKSFIDFNVLYVDANKRILNIVSSCNYAVKLNSFTNLKFHESCL